MSMFGRSDPDEATLPVPRDFGITLPTGKSEVVKAHKVELQFGCLVFFRYSIAMGQNEKGEMVQVPIGQIVRAYKEWLNVEELEPTTIIH